MANVKGGRWFVTIDRHTRAEKLDSYWLELIMAMVGEQFENYGDNICGAVVNVRQKGDKVPHPLHSQLTRRSLLYLGGFVDKRCFARRGQFPHRSDHQGQTEAARQGTCQI